MYVFQDTNDKRLSEYLLIIKNIQTIFTNLYALIFFAYVFPATSIEIKFSSNSFFTFYKFFLVLQKKIKKISNKYFIFIIYFATYFHFGQKIQNI